MKSFLTDLLILSSITGCVAAIMLLPPRSMRRIDRNWGRVIFDDPVTYATADRLSTTLVEANEFNGNPQIYRLTMVGDTLDLAIVVRRKQYEQIFNQKSTVVPSPKDQLISNLEVLCYDVFPDQRIQVSLMDENLVPFEPLIEETVFETQQVGKARK